MMTASAVEISANAVIQAEETRSAFEAASFD